MRMTERPESSTPGNWDDPAAPEMGRAESALVLGGLRLIQRAILVLVALLTLAATAFEAWIIYTSRTVNLADILLMFLYAEVIAMVAVFYTGRGQPFVFPIFIAITALARLIVIQGKDMDPVNILYEAGAILLLAVAAVVLMRAGSGGDQGGDGKS
jgi:protein PsiE